MSKDLYPKLLFLSENRDPDTYLQRLKSKGFSSKEILENFEQKIDSAPDLFMHLLKKWMKPFTGRAMDPIEKVQLAQELLPLFNSMKNTHIKQMYLKETAFKMGIDHPVQLQQMLQNLKKATPAQRNLTTLKTNNQTQSLKKEKEKKKVNEGFPLFRLKTLHPSELNILIFCLHSKKFLQMAMECQILNNLIHPQFKALFHRICDKTRQNREQASKLTSWLSSYVKDPEVLFPPQELLNKEGQLNETKANNIFTDSMIKIRQRFLCKQLDDLSLQLRNESNQSERNKKIKSFEEIKKELLALKDKELKVINL